MSIDGFVEVYDTRTGIKQRVPSHFLDDPILGAHIAKTPTQRALDGDPGDGVAAPDADATVADLRAYAESVGVDLTGLTRKADIAAAITAATGDAPTSATALGDGDPTSPPTQPVGGDDDTTTGTE